MSDVHVVGIYEHLYGNRRYFSYTQKCITKKQTTALLSTFSTLAKIDDKYVYLKKNVLFS